MNRGSWLTPVLAFGPPRETLSNRFRYIAVECWFAGPNHQGTGRPQKRTSLRMSRTPRRIGLHRPARLYHNESSASVPKGESVDFANDLPPDGVAGIASLFARGFLRY